MLRGLRPRAWVDVRWTGRFHVPSANAPEEICTAWMCQSYCGRWGEGRSAVGPPSVDSRMRVRDVNGSKRLVWLICLPMVFARHWCTLVIFEVSYKLMEPKMHEII